MSKARPPKLSKGDFACRVVNVNMLAQGDEFYEMIGFKTAEMAARGYALDYTGIAEGDVVEVEVIDHMGRTALYSLQIGMRIVRAVLKPSTPCPSEQEQRP
jgi:hypothetical protein